MQREGHFRGPKRPTLSASNLARCNGESDGKPGEGQLLQIGNLACDSYFVATGDRAGSASAAGIETAASGGSGEQGLSHRRVAVLHGVHVRPH